VEMLIYTFVLLLAKLCFRCSATHNQSKCAKLQVTLNQSDFRRMLSQYYNKLSWTLRQLN